MQLIGLFPQQVITVSATPEMWTSPVLPEEEALICRAADKRQREFRAGRHCARAALAKLGQPGQAILRDQRRAPVWPQGYLGSISHCRDYCLAACCAAESIQGLGVDVEPLAPLKPELAGYIQSEAESRFMQEHPELPDRLIFSAKESLYKCFYPLVKQYFGFHAVEIELATDNRQFNFTPTDEAPSELVQAFSFHGGYVTTDNHLITGCYLLRK